MGGGGEPPAELNLKIPKENFNKSTPYLVRFFLTNPQSQNMIFNVVCSSH
jgi:hypothetical protein